MTPQKLKQKVASYAPTSESQMLSTPGVSFDRFANRKLPPPTVKPVPTVPGVIDGYDYRTYATDPPHLNRLTSIMSGIGKFKTLEDVGKHIKSKFPTSPITPEMISSTSAEYGVPWEHLVSVMQQDSGLGTAGKGARTFNPGNVGNDDSGNMNDLGSWSRGVDRVGKWLSMHRVK